MDNNQFSTLMGFCAVAFVSETTITLAIQTLAATITCSHPLDLGTKKLLSHPLSRKAVLFTAIHITQDVYIALVRMPFL
jgi:hypothetical protein